MGISFDKQSGAYTDGTRFVKASLIRKHALEKLGKQPSRGRLPKADIEAYWLDVLGVSDNVE